MSPRTGRAHRRAGLTALVIALAGSLLGIPWLLGGHAERAHQGLHDELLRTLPPGAVLEDQYQRGWFRSQAHLAVELQSPTGSRAPAHLRIDSEIEQGPLHWLSSGWPPALARVRSQVELSDPSFALPPLQVITDLGAQGQGIARLRLPAGAGPIAGGAYQLSRGELRGDLWFEPSAGALSLSLDVPELELRDQAGPVSRLQDLRLTWVVRPATPRPIASGDQARAGEPRVREAPRYPLAGPMDLRLDLSAETLSLGQETYRGAQIGVAADRIDGSTLSDLASALGFLSAGASPPAVRRLMAAALLAKLLPRLTATEPRVSIHSARVDTPDGTLELRLHLGFDGGAVGGGSARQGVGRAGGWMLAFRADGAIAVPEPLARRWLAARGDRGTQGSGGQFPPGTPALQTWLDEGWVSLQDGRVTSSFQLAAGLLTVNGKTIPLLALPSAGPW